MTRRFDPTRLPDLSQKKTVDGHMDRLDSQGVSRRDFLAMASAGAAATAAAATMGLPAVAVADPSGKLAYLAWTTRVEYMVQANKAIEAATKALGLTQTLLDGQFDSQKQFNQFEQQVAAGTQSIILHASDGSALKRVSQIAEQNKVYFANVWATLPWFTPFDASEYYTLYAVPEEFSAHRGVTVELLKTVTEKFGGGDIIGVTGVPGFSTDTVRSRGRDDAFKDFPKTKLVGQLPGNFNREDSLKAAEDLLSRHKNVVGVVAQNDDVAQGVIAALKAQGLKPGVDVLVVGADGTTEGATAIRNGQQLATSANSPAYFGALFTARLFDVTHGWKPRAAERLLYWRSVTTTKANVETYFERYVDNKGVEPFDYRLLSKVIHPQDWDPQNEVFPLDIDAEWAGIPKPDGWTYPKAYLEAKQNGEWDAVTREYKEHYKIPFFGPSPNKKA
jgi:ABC-type sugar transport system substrate-binding protein